MDLIVKKFNEVQLLIERATIVETYRLNETGFWCVYRTDTGSNDGQFFVSEDEDLIVWHDARDRSPVG